MELQKRLKARQVREIFGGCSPTTLWRMHSVYGILPPMKIRGINYWLPEAVETAFRASQEGGISHQADTTLVRRRGRPPKSAAQLAQG